VAVGPHGAEPPLDGSHLQLPLDVVSAVVDGVAAAAVVEVEVAEVVEAFDELAPAVVAVVVAVGAAELT
jgi:hypothetical protein